MRVKIHSILGIILLTSCSTLQDLPDHKPDSINLIADMIECEIVKAFAEYTQPERLNFAGWTAGYTITQNTTSYVSGSANPLRWISPAGVDSLVYRADADADKEGWRNAKADYVFVVGNDTEACERVGSQRMLVVTPSDFRLREWVDQVSSSTGKQLTGFSYSVRVTITFGGGIGADFEDGRWTVGGGIAGKRTTIRTVDFQFTPPAPPAGPQLVFVVNQPSAPSARPPSSGQKSRARRPAPSNRVPATQQIVPDASILRNRALQLPQLLDRASPEFRQ